MKSAGVLLLLAWLVPLVGRAAELNLATLSCDKYENEIIGSTESAQNTDPAKHPDSIDTVMWLFGFSVGKSGEHFMYGDALTSFGFALDAECKNNPSTSLLQAVTTIRPKRDKPMNLSTLNCATWLSRHEESTHSDPESANTIMMWLFGFSVGQSGAHMFDASGVTRFASALQNRCAEHADDSLYDALAALNAPVKR
jgi:hypothetical protein